MQKIVMLIVFLTMALSGNAHNTHMSKNRYIPKQQTKLTAVNDDDNGGNFLVIKVTPSDASLYIDDREQNNDGNGEYSLFLSYGKHKYSIRKTGFAEKVGSVTIGQDITNIQVSLVSAMASLSVSCPTSGAKIYIDDIEKGEGEWSGELEAGTYKISVKKKGYHSFSQTVSLIAKGKKNIQIPALKPFYSTLMVNVRPVGSTIRLDGKEAGKTPMIIKNVQVGPHKLTVISKGGGILYKNVDVEENIRTSVEEIVSEPPSEDSTQIAKWYISMADNAEKNEDYEHVFDFLYKAANMKNAKGMFSLAECFYTAEFEKEPLKSKYALIANNNYNVSDCKAEMLKWYFKSSELGYGKASFTIGNLYSEGKGVPKDETEAKKMYEKATDQGYSPEYSHETMPSFHGGMGALMSYLSSHIQYPKIAKKNGIQGRVICTFIVEKDGSITDVEVAKSVDPSLDKEAVRVVRSMPKWIPGYQDGEPVRVKYTMPLTFRLQ